MTYGMFGNLFRPNLIDVVFTHNTAPRSCTSWYGHEFEKFDAATIFCPTCGTTKAVKA